MIDKTLENIDIILCQYCTLLYISIYCCFEIMKINEQRSRGWAAGLYMREFCGVIRHNAVMFNTLRWLYGDVFKAVKQTRGQIDNSIIVKKQAGDSGNNYSTVVWLYMPALYVHTGNSHTGGVHTARNVCAARKASSRHAWRIFKE